MRAIKKLFPKPSDAVFAMVNGLKKYSKQKTFQVDMDTFGAAEDSVCFGCAATCAIQYSIGRRFNSARVSTQAGRACEVSQTIPITKRSLDLIETAIDELRMGYPISASYGGMFYLYFNDEVPKKILRLLDRSKLPQLTTSDYLENLKQYEKFGKDLKAIGC